MTQKNLSFDEVLLYETGEDIDLLRYCLSDKTAHTLDCVIHDMHTPLRYAKTLISHDYVKLKTMLYDPHIRHKHVDRVFIEAWLTDRIVLAACSYRLSNIYTHPMSWIAKQMIPLYPFLLQMTDDTVPATQYSGLGDYASVGRSVLNSKRKTALYAFYLRKMIECVSSIDQADWLFAKPVWQKALLHQPARLKTLRDFLHLTLLGVEMPDAQMRDVFGLSIDKLTQHMQAFVGLCTKARCSTKNIVEFLNGIRPHYGDFPNHIVHGMWMEGPHEMFKQAYEQLYGPLCDQPTWNPIWSFLRTLPNLQPPEVVIETPMKPGEYITSVLNHQKDPVTDFLLTDTYESLDRSVPDNKDSVFIDAIVRDRLLQQLAFRRYLHHYNGIIEKAMHHTQRTEHITLLMAIVIDPKTTHMNHMLGFWKTPEWLLHHAENNAANLSAKECNTVCKLAKRIAKLNVLDPQSITPQWQAIFDHPMIMDTLRHFLFSVIESLYITDETDFANLLSVDRATFYAQIKALNRLLKSSPDIDEFSRLLEYMTYIKMPKTLTQWDNAIWLDTFPQGSFLDNQSPIVDVGHP